MKKYTGELPWEKIYNTIRFDWSNWAIKTNTSKFIIGISGGKDSTCCAALATRIFGKENVIGVLMPNGIQNDIEDARNVCKQLEITSYEINIKEAVESITSGINIIVNMSSQARINLPARVRMATLFAVAQTIGGKVINTCNMSEDYIGYSTLFGDDCGAYAPLAQLTCTEVKNFTKWLGVDEGLAFKTPSDGLCGKSDEDNLGFTYFELDKYIRTGEWDNYNTFKKIRTLNKKNSFKEEIIHLPHPELTSIIVNSGYYSG